MIVATGKTGHSKRSVGGSNPPRPASTTLTHPVASTGYMNYLTKLLMAAVLTVIIMVVGTHAAAAPAPQFVAATTTAVTVVPPKPLTLDEKIEAVAKKYEVNAALMRAVIKCESSFRHDAIGDNGTSFGLVQIHRPSHPTITKEQAFDVDFALEFLASNLAKGKGDMWTCYRMIVY